MDSPRRDFPQIQGGQQIGFGLGRHAGKNSAGLPESVGNLFPQGRFTQNQRFTKNFGLELPQFNIELGQFNTELGRLNIELRWFNTELGGGDIEVSWLDIELGGIKLDPGQFNAELRRLDTELGRGGIELSWGGSFPCHFSAVLPAPHSGLGCGG
jgi:hypothetical protein